MDSSTKIYIDSEKLWPKIREWDLFELTLQNDAKKPKKFDFKGVENQKNICLQSFSMGELDAQKSHKNCFMGYP